MNGKPDPQRCRFCEHYDPHGSTNVSWRYPWVSCTSYASLSLSGSTIQQACFSTTFHPIRKPVISFHQVSSVKSCVLFGVLNIFGNFAFK